MSVCSSRWTALNFDEVIRPHWPWLVDSNGSYFHMYAFSGLSVNHASRLCLFLYSPFYCVIRASQKFFTSILSTLSHLKFLLAVAHFDRRCLFRLGPSWSLAICGFIALGGSSWGQTRLYTLNPKQQFNLAVVWEFVLVSLQIHSNKFLSHCMKFLWYVIQWFNAVMRN